MLEAGLRELVHAAESPAAGLSLGLPGVRDVELTGAAGIDDGDPLKFPDTLEVQGGICLMDMAVEHDRRPILAKEGLKALKAPVGQIRLIADSGDRGVGQEDIESAGGTDLPAER